MFRTVLRCAGIDLQIFKSKFLAISEQFQMTGLQLEKKKKIMLFQGGIFSGKLRIFVPRNIEISLEILMDNKRN
jgi:hypothetical protein